MERERYVERVQLRSFLVASGETDLFFNRAGCLCGFVDENFKKQFAPQEIKRRIEYGLSEAENVQVKLIEIQEVYDETHRFVGARLRYNLT